MRAAAVMRRVRVRSTLTFVASLHTAATTLMTSMTSMTSSVMARAPSTLPPSSSMSPSPSYRTTTATSTTTTYDDEMTSGTPTTELYSTIVDSVESDMNEANSQAAEESSSSSSSSSAGETWTPTCPTGYTGGIAGPACSSYATCNDGAWTGAVIECTPGTLYNKVLGICDHEYNVVCYSSGGVGDDGENTDGGSPGGGGDDASSPSPTVIGSSSSSSSSSSMTGSTSPYSTPVPTIASPSSSSSSSSSSGTASTRMPNANVGFEDALDHAKIDIDGKLLQSQSTAQDGGEVWKSSAHYRYDDLIVALRIMYLEGVGGGGGNDEDDDGVGAFYVGRDVTPQDGPYGGITVGLVNLAAFLAQSMKETIKYDACDENNWDILDGRYPISNSCGQLNQTYGEYACPAGYEHMQCDVDPDMEMVAYTHANWYGAPRPLYCGPRSKYPFTGYWDTSYTCDYSWEDPPRYCEDYDGQRGGREVTDEPVMNRRNRSDVEGCCWWGRGVIQTTGICNFGMLNYYLGKRAADEGRTSRYPDVDFCANPSAICDPGGHVELKWIAGMFYWIRSVQTYDSPDWNYMDKLKSFVSGGLVDDAFIDAVSGIVNRGCHSPPCPNGSGALDGGDERRGNFEKVLGVLLEPDGSPRAYQEAIALTYTPSTEPGATPSPSNAIGDDSANEGELEDEDWTDEGEEDWTDDAGADTSTMSLWCGESQSNAYKNCNREGYDCPDGVCFNGLKCFMVGDTCDEESEGIDDDSSSQIETSSSPTSATTGNNVGVLGQFCAETFEALESACATATICEVPEDCPSGTYCWKEYMCGGTVSTTSPSVTSALTSTNSPSLSLSGTYFCGTDRAHASTSCHKQCPNGLNEDCDDGETCFAYVTCGDGSTSAPTPESESAEQPSQELAMSSSQQPTRGNVVSSPPQTADTVQQLFCASTKEELEASCSTAPSCISEPCPSKMFCFPYTCVEAVDDDNSTQASTALAEDQGSPAAVESTPAPVEINQLQCPQSEFVGWHTSKDCKEYFKCDKGAMGVVHVCGDSLKFDKVRNQCHPEEEVNTFCYGPPQSTISSGGLCPDGSYTGWKSRNGCHEYYWCDLGYADVIYDCGQDLLFDIALELCNFAVEVVCVENGSAPIESLTQPPPAPLSLVDTPAAKQPTLRPSALLGATPTPLPEYPGSNDGIGANGSYSGVGGVVGDYDWSSDSSATNPTESQNASDETPPWLLNTVMKTNNSKCVVAGVDTKLWMIMASVIFLLIHGCLF